MQKSNTSQEQRILAYLKSGRSLTPMQALKLFSCFRLASRIHSLRKKHKIKNVGEEKNGKVYGRYVLVK